jgi:hypothetical protein
MKIQIHNSKTRDVTALPSYRNLIPSLKRGYKKGRDYNALLRWEEIRIIQTKKFLGLPGGFFFKMIAPLNLTESNRSSPRDLVLLTQKLY